MGSIKPFLVNPASVSCSEIDIDSLLQFLWDYGSECIAYEYGVRSKREYKDHKRRLVRCVHHVQMLPMCCLVSHSDSQSTEAPSSDSSRAHLQDLQVRHLCNSVYQLICDSLSFIHPCSSLYRSRYRLHEPSPGPITCLSSALKSSYGSRNFPLLTSRGTQSHPELYTRYTNASCPRTGIPSVTSSIPHTPTCYS